MEKDGRLKAPQNLRGLKIMKTDDLPICEVKTGIGWEAEQGSSQEANTGGGMKNRRK
jgi:hypothetical protein